MVNIKYSVFDFKSSHVFPLHKIGRNRLEQALKYLEILTKVERGNSVTSIRILQLI